MRERLLANHPMVTRLTAGLKPREFGPYSGINRLDVDWRRTHAAPGLEEMMQSVPTDPPHPKNRLVSALHDPVQVERVAEQMRALCSDDPASPDAVFVSLFLHNSGFQLPVTRDAEELVLRLMVGGWQVRRGREAAVSAGDVYVVSGADSKPAELGLVGKVALDGSWCYALDSRVAPPYRPARRALTGDAAPPLSYHLHFG